MDHDNSDDKSGSIIQETEGQRTEMSASGDVIVESEPSTAQCDNFNTVTRIPENRMKQDRGVSPAGAMDHPGPFKRELTTPDSCEFHFANLESVSPAPSGLSMRSDWSMGRPINFRESVLMMQDRGVSPAVSNVSIKSDWSMDHPGNFKRELTTPDSGEGHFAKPERVSPTPSCQSMASDWSIDHPFNFKEMMEQDRGVFPAVSCASMKSDWSMDHPDNFKRELTTPDSGVGPSPAPSCLSVRSDWSMDHPHNFKESLMEFSSSVVDNILFKSLPKYPGSSVDVSHPPVPPGSTNRKDFLIYSCSLTFDPNTIHCVLSLSEGNRKVTSTSPQYQRYLNHPDRFHWWPQVLSRESLPERCYFELQWSGEVGLSVDYKEMNRKDKHLSGFGNNDMSWRLWYTGKYSYWFKHNDVDIEVAGPVPSRVGNKWGVYLDHKAGSVSFYSVSNNTMKLIHSVQTTFTQPLYAGLGVGVGGTAELCKIW